MNVPTRQAKLSKADWSRHKETIIRLYLDEDLSLTELAQKMATDDGFLATASQLEFKLKSWRVRKNLKAHEWKPILEELDRAPQGTRTRVVISGREVPKHRIERARLHFNKQASRQPSMNDTTLSEALNDDQVCIQMQKPDGTWVAYSDVIRRSPPFSHTDHVQHHTGSMLAQTRQELATPEFSQYLREVGDAGHMNELSPSSPIQPTENISMPSPTRPTGYTPLLSSSTQPYFGENGNAVFRWEGGEVPRSSPTSRDGQIDLTTSPARGDASNTQELLQPDASNHVRSNRGHVSSVMLRPPAEWGWLANLPFQQLETTWKTVNQQGFDAFEKGLTLSSKLGVWCFIEEVSNVAPRWYGDKPLSRPALERFIRTGMTYLPKRGISAQVDRGSDNDYTLVTEDDMSNTNLFRLIIFSIMNGLAGLEGVPVEGIVQFLDRFQNTRLLISLLLQLSERHTAKAIVESLLSTAISQNKESVVTELLATNLIDLAGKLRLLNITVHTGNLKLSNIFLDKILLSVERDNGNLIDNEYLRRLLRDVVTFPSEWTPFVRRLLDAGVNLTWQDLEVIRFFGRFEFLCYTELCNSIASSMDHSQHAKHIAAHWFVFVTQTLDEVAATEVIQQFISCCHDMHNSECIHLYQREFDLGVIRAAKRGFCDLVRLQLPLCRSLSGVLCAAIQGGSENLINLVMDQQPDINETCCFEHPDCDMPSMCSCDCKPTSALSEALRTENAQLTQTLECAGVLDHLSEKRFDAAITAAAEMKRISYFEKLIHCRSIGGVERSKALVLSINNGWDAIAMELINVGCAEIDGKILRLAIQQRNGPIVQKILNAGIDSSESGFGLHQAIEWGDKSLITQLLSNFRYPDRWPRLDRSLGCMNLHICEIHGWNDMFEFLLGTKLATQEALTACLKWAVREDDRDFLEFLIDQGADPLDSEVLEVAVHYCPSMLRLLLIPRNQNKRKITRGLRTGVLKEAIRSGRDASLIRALIDSGTIDIFDSKDLDQFSQPMLNTLGEAIALSNKNPSLSLEITTILLDAGCNPNDIVEWGVHRKIPNVNQTALLKGIETMDRSIVQTLLDRGANINEPTICSIKRTPLQKAAETGNLELVQLLINRGADVNGEPAYQGGGTALQMAAISGNCNVAAELLSKGALLHTPPSKMDGRWPLEGAAEHGRLDMIEFLWRAKQEFIFCGGETGFEKEHCIRAMQLAEGKGHLGCKDLIERLSGFNLSQPRLTEPSGLEQENDFSEDEESLASLDSDYSYSI
ncbi:hypothetical protein F5B19DRAFT_499843 [Rostrohypoxylon terebratum]|nr:hypothetical protein F5B19DRAFT_499843 [Rostrohypoxylon terebratum]